MEDRLHGLRDEFNSDVARARAGIEVELRRLFEAQQGATARDSAGAASASHIIEMHDRLPRSTEQLGGENAEVESLREQVALLESRRDALLEEGRRRLAADRHEMIESFAARERQQAANAQAAQERLDKRTADAAALLEAKQSALQRDRAAFSAASDGRTFQLTGLLAEAWADYENLQARLLAEELVQRAAFRAAETVREKGRELAKDRRRTVRAEWVVRLYEKQVPWLPELRDLEEEQAYVETGDDPPTELETESDGEENAEIDPARRWLTAEEWRGLSPTERNQRALNRYFAGRRTPWQLGRDYERYVGYLRETEGYRVTYQGMIAGLEDMGRDLIALRGNEVEVIQCKRWSHHKTIHEKHLFQLYGTYVYAALDYPDKDITASFVTTTSLSRIWRGGLLSISACASSNGSRSAATRPSSATLAARATVSTTSHSTSNATTRLSTANAASSGPPRSPKPRPPASAAPIDGRKAAEWAGNQHRVEPEQVRGTRAPRACLDGYQDAASQLRSGVGRSLCSARRCGARVRLGDVAIVPTLAWLPLSGSDSPTSGMTDRQDCCKFVRAGVSSLVDRVKFQRSEEARRDDHQVVASLRDRGPDGT